MTRHGGGSPDGWLRRFRSWVRVARCRRCGGGEVRRAERMNADAYASRANSRGIRGSAPAVDRGAGQWTWLDGNDGDGGGGAWWWWWMAWGEPDSGSGSGSGNGNGGAGVDGPTLVHFCFAADLAENYPVQVRQDAGLHVPAEPKWPPTGQRAAPRISGAGRSIGSRHQRGRLQSRCRLAVSKCRGRPWISGAARAVRWNLPAGGGAQPRSAAAGTLPAGVDYISRGDGWLAPATHAYDRTGLWGSVGTPDASIPSIGAVLPHKSPHQPPKIQAAEYLMLPPTACVGAEVQSSPPNPFPGASDQRASASDIMRGAALLSSRLALRVQAVSSSSLCSRPAPPSAHVPRTRKSSTAPRLLPSDPPRAPARPEPRPVSSTLHDRPRFLATGPAVKMGAQSKPEISPWGRAAAGATGAVLANALVYPLDIVKTRLQVQVKSAKAAAGADDSPHYASTWDAISRIVADDGLKGLYAGMNGSLLGVASTNFAYFYWYTVARSLYISSAATAAPSMATELSLGAVAGALAQLFTIPVAVVTTRQQTARADERKGLLATAREVVEGPDGVSGLWRGLKASLVLVVNPAITYGAYERLRTMFFRDKSTLQPWEAFLLGAMSKALATILTQPLIVAKVGLQSKPPPARNGKPFTSFIEVMNFIIEHEGPLALFKGIGPQIFKGFLVQGILMMTKERVELLFVLFLRYLKSLRSTQLQKAAKVASAAAQQGARNGTTRPLTTS
ncbi:hypothetical protein Purlil1_5733 [Purpureocillium lilacinum]|uniref:Peroxisomal adenine nucleotide transporter 1 n=1 Tax=Purpureocillium lilacinum TaxID=33203 RepID=A0ABR0C1D2_PURLI|nr:hypothetical protein Purlil1_5733 [Purpureocillium lilacinum]